MCKTLAKLPPAHLCEAQRRRFSTVVAVPVHVKHLQQRVCAYIACGNGGPGGDAFLLRMSIIGTDLASRDGEQARQDTLLQASAQDDGIICLLHASSRSSR